MEDTAAEPTYLAVMDDAAEPDYLAVMDDAAEPDYFAVTDDAAEPDYLAVMDDAAEPGYFSEINDNDMEDTAAPEYTAAKTGPANNPTYHETIANANESTHTDQIITAYNELAYDDIEDMASSPITDTQLQVAEPQTRSRYSCKIPRLIRLAISLSTTVVAITLLIAIVAIYSLGILKLTDNAAKANFSNNKTLAYSQVKSVKHSCNFTLGLNLTNHGHANILSVSSEGLLLVGQRYDQRQFHVYNSNCFYVTSIKLPTNKHVYDAVWTRSGNIVYNEADSGNIVTMSQSGDIIRKGAVFFFSYLSVSTDGVIYIIHKQKDVYQSTDEGLTWSHVFNVSVGWKCDQVIKVSTNGKTDLLWTSIWLDIRTRFLRVYTVDNRRAYGDRVISQRDVAVPKHVSIYSRSKLVYDGHTSIFATDSANVSVHVLSVSGQYGRQLVSLQKFVSNVWCIGVDGRHHVMYVGHDKGRVDVFELTYEPL